MPGKVRELPVAREPTAYLEKIEARIRRAFLKELYGPLMRELTGERMAIYNAKDDLLEAIRIGRITYDPVEKAFRGKFSAALSKELRALGASWHGKSASYRLVQKYRTYARRAGEDKWMLAGTSSTRERAEALARKLETPGAVSPKGFETKVEALGDVTLPPEIRAALAAASSRFEERIAAVDARLAKVLPENISEKIIFSDLFDDALYKSDKTIRKTLDDLTVLPELSPEQRRRISEEWATNLEKTIKTFAESEILRLRRDVYKSVTAGNRYETMVSTIQHSYGVTAGKAKFLARQETNLLMAKFKETRYAAAGVTEYRWGCVNGSPNHPVRPAHKALEGKVFRWDDPPITTEPDEPARRNNPGEDFNCRCFARPLIRFKD